YLQLFQVRNRHTFVVHPKKNLFLATLTLCTCAAHPRPQWPWRNFPKTCILLLSPYSKRTFILDCLPKYSVNLVNVFADLGAHALRVQNISQDEKKQALNYGKVGR